MPSQAGASMSADTTSKTQHSSESSTNLKKEKSDENYLDGIRRAERFSQDLPSAVQPKGSYSILDVMERVRKIPKFKHQIPKYVKRVRGYIALRLIFLAAAALSLAQRCFDGCHRSTDED